MIEAEGLGKAYGRQWALAEVTFTVPAGGAVAVLGHNGSGKTTLLRLLGTLTRPSAGRGSVAGRDVVRDRDRVREIVGYVGHGTQLYDDLTARENLAFAAALAGLRPGPGSIEAALARVGLGDQADARARTLSAGMRRRLALARVWLRRAPVLLLDEPFAGLDPDGARRLDDDLQAFRVGGGTVILVTHSPARALAVADRVLVLLGGRLVADQPVAALTEAALQRLYASAEAVAG